MGDPDLKWALRPELALGPHEIVAPLGAGDMGEVYRAHDPRLNRAIAIKILPRRPRAIWSVARGLSARPRA